MPPESARATGQFKEAKELLEILAGRTAGAPRRRRSVGDVATRVSFSFPLAHQPHSICSIDNVDDVHLLHTASQGQQRYRSKIISVCEMSPSAVPIGSLLAVLAMKSR